MICTNSQCELWEYFSSHCPLIRVESPILPCPGVTTQALPPVTWLMKLYIKWLFPVGQLQDKAHTNSQLVILDISSGFKIINHCTPVESLDIWRVWTWRIVAQDIGFWPHTEAPHNSSPDWAGAEDEDISQDDPLEGGGWRTMTGGPVLADCVELHGEWVFRMRQGMDSGGSWVGKHLIIRVWLLGPAAASVWPLRLDWDQQVQWRSLRL